MAAMGPDERVFRAHVKRGVFKSGEARGRWRLASIDWPHATVCVSAASRDAGPEEYAFRFELSDYPQTAPTAQPWDLEKGAPLDTGRWPAGTSHVSRAFNPAWNAQAIYLPFDRQAILGHDAWRTQHPHLIWSPDKDITLYLRNLHELLTSKDYTGPRSA